MRPASRWSWFAASAVVIGVMAVGVVFPGCSPAPTPQAEEPSGPEESLQPQPTQPAPGLQPKPAPKSAPELEPEPKPGPKPRPGPQPGPADPSATPKVSSFAPAEDLAGQVDYYLERLEKAVASQEEYKDSQDRIAMDSNTLIVIALGLGLHDEDAKHKGIAPLLLKQTQELAAAKDYASAKAAVAAVKGTVGGFSSPYAAELKWEKVASLPELMKQIPLINTKLKGCIRRLEKRAKDGQGHSAVIALIAQASMPHAGDTDKPGEVEKWQQYCVQMREMAAAVNQGIRALDKDATAAAMKGLTQSCDDCHAVFHPEELQ